MFLFFSGYCGNLESTEEGIQKALLVFFGFFFFIGNLLDIPLAYQFCETIRSTITGTDFAHNFGADFGAVTVVETNNCGNHFTVDFSPEFGTDFGLNTDQQLKNPHVPRPYGAEPVRQTNTSSPL